MRIGLTAACLVCMLPGPDSQYPAGDRDLRIVDEQFFATLQNMIPANYATTSRDSFSVESASWNETSRLLQVNVSTEHEKGTLVTLTGLPASTMLDAFRISGNHGVRYALPLALDQAVPCQLTIRSAFATETVTVANAPQACQNMLQLSGNVADDSGISMAHARVTVTVDEIVFATYADQRGDFSLRVYGQAPDARVTVTATGKTGDRETAVPLYSGTLDRLLGQQELGASMWAKEILGRRHQRRMLAALDSFHNRENLHQDPYLPL